jgi:hypothetical protein
LRACRCSDLDVNLSSKIWFISFSGFPIAARRPELWRIWYLSRVWVEFERKSEAVGGESGRREGGFVGTFGLGEMDLIFDRGRGRRPRRGFGVTRLSKRAACAAGVSWAWMQYHVFTGFVWTNAWILHFL